MHNPIRNPEYEAFFKAQSEDGWPPPVHMIDALRSLMADPSFPASEAAQQAASIYIQQSDPNPDYTSLWPLLFDAIEKFTEQNERLLDFLVEFQRLPDHNGVFHQLNGLTEYLVEFVFDYVDHPFYDTQRDQKRQGWININAFTAKLHNTGIRPEGRGQLHHASWVLRKTLEKAPWEVFHHADIEECLDSLQDGYVEDYEGELDEEYNDKRDHFLEEIDIRTLNGWIPGAAQWIMLCGKEIYEMEGSMGREWPTKWTGIEGWSKERWSFWRQRFEWASTVTALDRKTRQLAREMCVLAKESGSEQSSSPCTRCLRRDLPCSRSQAKLADTRKLQARPNLPAESQNGSNRLEGFLSDAKSVELLVQEYLSKIHGRPHCIFHTATLWRDIRNRRIGKALLLAICAMGAHVSSRPNLRSLQSLLTTEAKRLLQMDLERVCLENVQTCILVANLCVAHANPSSEFLFFRTAITMMQLIRPFANQESSNAVSHELWIRIWWALFAADNWCSSSLGFPRQMKDWPRPGRSPMDETLFTGMDPDAVLHHPNEPCKSPGLWAHMATLHEIFGPIQELNWLVATNKELQPNRMEQDVEDLAQRLDGWEKILPEEDQMTDSNLVEHSERGTGGIFMGLHLGFHHYATLLFYQYLDPISALSPRGRQFAARCKHHALSYSTWLARGRGQSGCEAMYPTVGHMAIVSSSVLLHTLLFGEENEISQSHHCLKANFEALLELKEYWPNVSTMIDRLMEFQNNCLLLSHRQETHRLDRWMVRFLLEYALPLDDKAIAPPTASEMEIISTQAQFFSQKGRLPEFGVS
ncbi:hypothetical protein BDV36DRAFT_311748 [Aspergillus pseudocaelatus]|uniref:Xylanolytic transcriptional activator regulatory domain-containing protein n=1 Tax=Aspergillus pseudocaelatus TaxID=1825620 RepID=A0ABQ6WBQ1_9EURO|nr:hypothetical protein BDV36DRAFT_311748 [Aspergillus pseudocaelatus]